MYRFKMILIVGLTCLLTSCGSGTPDEDLVLSAINSLFRCEVNGNVLGSLETIEAKQLLFLAPGKEGPVYRYKVRISGRFGSNINVVDLYDKDGTWVAHLEAGDNSVSGCAPDTLNWYVVND
jgi:hypothetical protein